MANAYKSLVVWQEARKLAILCYRNLGSFPKREQFGLISQITRTAVSIPANIAEGYSRKSPKDMAHFLDIAIGSLFELETLLEISFELRYFTEMTTIGKQLESTIKLLYGLKRSVKTLNSKPSTLNQ